MHCHRRQGHHSARVRCKAGRKRQEKIVSLDAWLLRIDSTNIHRLNNMHAYQLTTGESDLIDGLISGANGDKRQGVLLDFGVIAFMDDAKFVGHSNVE
jgi:hypothetical protein